MKIMFTGDINFRMLENLDYDKSTEILSEVMPYVKEADFVIPNLECPLGEEADYTPIKKSGPNLICGENNVCFLKAMNAYGVTIGNNHIGDFGDEALRNTLKVLDENNIRYAGAGENIEKAYEPIRIESENTTVSILSACENEFGLATETKPGSAAYNTRRLFNKIKAEKECGNLVIVVFHGGNEHNPLPSPDSVDHYRMFCDMGADAVVAGHTHCPQGYEMYDGKPIVYSMGNFFFNFSAYDAEKAASNPWYYGYVTMLDIQKSGISAEIVPYKFDISKITVFDGEEKALMMKYIESLSEIIQNPIELKEHFKGWAMCHLWTPTMPEDIDNLENYPAGGNYNQITCEAHLSLSRQIFEILFNDEVAAAKKRIEEIQTLAKMPV